MNKYCNDSFDMYNIGRCTSTINYVIRSKGTMYNHVYKFNYAVRAIKRTIGVYVW